MPSNPPRLANPLTLKKPTDLPLSRNHHTTTQVLKRAAFGDQNGEAIIKIWLRRGSGLAGVYGQWGQFIGIGALNRPPGSKLESGTMPAALAISPQPEEHRRTASMTAREAREQTLVLPLAAHAV